MSDETDSHITEDFVTRREGEETPEETRERMEAENRLREEARVEAGQSLPTSL